MYIHGGVCDVVVSGDDELGACFFERLHPIEKEVEKFHFNSLSYFSGSAGGKVAIEECPIAEVGAKDTAFLVVCFVATAFDYLVRFFFVEGSHAAVSRFYSGMPGVFIAEGFQMAKIDLFFASFGFL